MLNWIERKTSGVTIIILLLSALTVYGVMMFVTIPEVRAGSGGVEVFDLRPFGYGKDDAALILESLSDAGRNYYRNVQIPVDFIYPLLMGLFGAFTLAWIRRKVSIPQWSILVPLAAGAFDYLENIGVLILLGGYVSDTMVVLASICSISKSILTTIFMTALLVLLVIMIAKRLQRES